MGTRRFGRALEAIAGLETRGAAWNTDDVFGPPHDTTETSRAVAPQAWTVDLYGTSFVVGEPHERPAVPRRPGPAEPPSGYLG